MRLDSVGHAVRFGAERYDSSPERVERNEQIISVPLWCLILLGRERTQRPD